MRDPILVVDDEPGSREGLRRLLEAWGYQAETADSGEQALDRLDGSTPQAVITDLVMPGMDGLELLRRVREEHTLPVILLTGQGTIEQAVEAIRLGAQDILEKPVEPSKLKILLEKLDGARELQSEIRRLREELRQRGAFGRLRGVSRRMQEVYEQIEQVAPSTLSVLVTGESGTGKELVAQTLHELSARRRQPFVEVNCAAIPASLLESEIFGHERGAFTGATERKTGCFEMAHRGTLFLDEVAEMDASLQAKMLRVIQEQRFRRLGGSKEIESDVRIVAATNRDPQASIRDGKLRQDLYYRLNGFRIELPPLRERLEDIDMLSRHLAEAYAERSGTDVPDLDRGALLALMKHDWPGNVRELKNAIERASLLSGGGTIRVEHLPPEIARDPDSSAAALAPLQGAPTLVLPVGTPMEDVEREVIRATLEHTGGNKTQAAKILGIALKTIHNKVKKFEL